MEKQNEKFTEELKNEPKITSEELLEEILSLLKESFFAKIRLCGDEISLRFFNGQHARLTVWMLSEKPLSHLR